MNARKMALAAVLAMPLALSGSYQAWAHGASADPPDRGFFCRFNDSVEAPKTPGCQAVNQNGGSSQLYNYMAVLTPNGNQKSLDAVPENGACNAGNPAYPGFALAPEVAGYNRTPIQAGPRMFQYKGTAPHKTAFFDIFITKPGYDGTRPVMKADLDLVQRVTDSQLAGDMFRFMVNIPSRPAGSKATLAIVWSRVAQESGEAYYTCADVIYQ